MPRVLNLREAACRAQSVPEISKGPCAGNSSIHQHDAVPYVREQDADNTLELDSELKRICRYVTQSLQALSSLKRINFDDLVIYRDSGMRLKRVALCTKLPLHHAIQ